MNSPRSAVLLSLLTRYATFIIQFVATIILARLLTPEELGIFSVGMAIVAIAHTVRDFGISNYIIQERELTAARTQTAFSVAVLVAWGIAALLATLAAPAADFYDDQRLRMLLLILAGTFLPLPFSSVRMALFRRAMAFGPIFRINILSALIYAASAILLVYFGLSVTGLALASVLSAVATAIMAMLYRYEILIYRPCLSDLGRILSFTTASSATSVVNQIGESSPDFIISKLLGFSANGLFSRAVGLIRIVETSIMDAVRSVALPYFATAIRGKGSVAEAWSKVSTLTLGVTWPAMLTLALLASPLIEVLYGAKWLAASAVAQILFIGAACRNLSSMLAPAVLADGHVGKLFRAQTLMQSAKIGLVILGALHGLEAVALGYILGEVVGTLAHAYLGHKYIGVTWAQQRAVVVRAILIVTPIAVAATTAHHFAQSLNSAPLDLLLTSSAAAASWLATLFLFRHPLASEIQRATHRLTQTAMQIVKT
jgi:O-antigen/teichoic acid export membrane protein